MFLGWHAVYCQLRCPRIASILVNACAPPNREAEFEMVRLVVGKEPVEVSNSNMVVIWPNNSWKRLCRNSRTAALVRQINASIRGCGYVKEPEEGILTPYSHVLLIGSTEFDPGYHSDFFTDLQDTLILLFQCSGNSASGHFANGGDSRPRTLTIRFISEECNLTASYIPDSLKGIDGERVDFDESGKKRYYNPGCRVPTEQYPIPQIVPSGKQTICQGDSLLIRLNNLPSLPSQFFWLHDNEIIPNNTKLSFFLKKEGKYQAAIRYPKRCTSILSLPLELVLHPIIVPHAHIAALPNQRRCEGDTVALWAQGGKIIKWFHNGIPLPNTEKIIKVNESGKYTVIVQADTLCPAQDTTTFDLEFWPKPRASLNIVRDTAICIGDSLRLEAGGGRLIGYLKDNILLTDTVSPLYVKKEGMYRVIVQGVAECTVRDTSKAIRVKVLYPPLPFDLPQDTLLEPGQVLILTAPASEGDNIVWHPEGQSSPTIIVTQAGKYVLTLYNRCGQAKDSIEVKYKDLREVSEVFVPNVITPNDDGINDSFKIQFNFVPTFYELSIFDRWGKLVFYANHPSNSWQPVGLPAGVYNYVLSYQLLHSPKIQRKGVITVIR
ncbi:MAG: gliding motility-associated C-terminal domain-containing protein [Bacteroidia bacterium]|nr:gliding motility-associated C-terminal domain-containing protein [Bacteroidia bacterium]MDW8157503.1 gliding motility-associated C-terminal domain-containing protein [Bacteroidia bacterium]